MGDKRILGRATAPGKRIERYGALQKTACERGRTSDRAMPRFVYAALYAAVQSAA
jgi:hypothetical protein